MGRNNNNSSQRNNPPTSIVGNIVPINNEVNPHICGHIMGSHEEHEIHQDGGYSYKDSGLLEEIICRDI